ncbi:hypothetical protein HOLleu_06357 [Holothuria leucospilota]|uniref:Uncharacterized protein n=1 Tax=Holothuria leucospilota TaxID=206669 RepID=A0A9Q1CLD1_HOLLE|nr:hypothetical protein HOLleu_06357 [Holothuria leucospilota]
MFCLSVDVGKNILPTNSKRDPPLKSASYTLQKFLSGPILRVKHLVKKSSNLSTCEVVGEGLHRAEVGVISSITVILDPMRTQDFQQFFFSVLAVGEDHIFPANPQPVFSNSTNITFTYVPTLPGEYDLYVEEIFQRPPWQKQVPGSPFRLIVQGHHELNTDDFKVQTDNLPSCQTISRKDPSWVEGEWMTRKLTGRKHGVLRSGWVFQPKRCSFDIFTTDDIEIAAASKVPKTIAILGSSRERGIFLSLVDLALRKQEKLHIVQSDLSKCWGFVEFQLGNLHFIYQDFRVYKVDDIHATRNEGVNITCHNEKIAKEGNNLFQDAMKFLEKTLFGSRLWPDIIFLDTSKQKLSLLVEKIPPSWGGTIYPVQNFKSKCLAYYNALGLLAAQNEAKASLSVDPRVDILDGFTLSTGMRHATQSSPFIIKSHHLHHFCKELNGEMRVCGNPTEMIAQFLLGQVIAPKGRDVWMKSIDYKMREKVRLSNTRTIRVCHDCPKTLMPFHIKSEPDLHCYESAEGLQLNLEQTYTVWNDRPCPKECMQTQPVGKVYTQSGSVDVRQCTIR